MRRGRRRSALARIHRPMLNHPTKPLHAFPTTRHSLVIRSRSPDSGVRARALDALLTAYWKPVYKYLRVRWHASADDAQDLTQSFFLPQAMQRLIDRYDPAQARFRTFLRTCLDRFAANERKAALRLKRGGDAQKVSLSLESAEEELRQHGMAQELDMDAYFHREWVRSLFALAVEAFRAEANAAGKAVQFAIFERYDLEANGALEKQTYADLAREFAIPASQVTNHLAFARREFRRIVLERLGELCGSEEEFREEARDLLGVDPR